MQGNSGFAIAILVVVALTVAWLLHRLARWSKERGGFNVTVYEWQHALRYVDGRFDRVLPPGRYVNWPGLHRRDIFTIRKTEQLDQSQPVDVTSKDGLVFRMSATVRYRVADPRQAYEEDHIEKIRLAASQALVKLAAAHDLRQLLSERAPMDAALKALIDATVCGCEIVAAAVQSITMPPEIRRLFAEIERAKLEGVAALERARGENAALRSLSNAAGMLKGNPELMNLRVLQSMATPSGKNQLTLVMGRDGLLPTGNGVAAAAEPS